MTRLSFAILLFLFTCRVAVAQQVAMRIFNGSFEDFQANNGFGANGLMLHHPPFQDTLYHWFGKGYTLIVQDGYCLNNGINSDTPDTSIKPVAGDYFLMLVSGLNYNFINHQLNYSIGGIGQKPKCGFKAGVKYQLSFFVTYDTIRDWEYIENDECKILLDSRWVKPALSVWLGDASVGFNFYNWYHNPGNNYQPILSEYECQYVEWEKISITFTPERDFDYIYFHNITSDVIPFEYTGVMKTIGHIILDAVSDIYYAEPTFLLPPNDTILKGECYQVEPYNIHPHPANHSWYVLGSDSLIFQGASPELCPEQTTTYVVISNDACGWAESDTITIFVNQKQTVPPRPQSSFSIYPNPALQGQQININSSHQGSIRLFDAAGRLIGEYAVQHGDQSIAVNFAEGVYFYQARLSDESVKRGKYLIVKN